MINFTKIRSEYVINKIKTLKHNKKNEEYIKSLMDIEKIAQGESLGMTAGHIIIKRY